MDVMYDLPETKGPAQVTIRATDITGETTTEVKKLQKKTRQSA